MKINISTAILSAALKKTYNLVKDKHSLSILDYYLFDIKNEQITITAVSDAHVRVSIAINSFEKDTSDEIKIGVPAKIKEIIDVTTSESVTLNFTDTSLEIISKTGVSKIIILDVLDGYPNIDFREKNNVSFDMSANKLINVIDSVSYACSASPLKPVIQSVHFEVKNNMFCVVGTDAQCMSVVEMPFECADFETNVMANQIALVKSVFNPQTNINVSINATQVKFEQDGDIMICNTIEGNYPNFRRIIPQDINYQTSVKKVDFLKMLSRVKVCANISTLITELAFKGETLTAFASDVAFGTSANDTIPCDLVAEEFKIGMKLDNLIKTINAIPSEEVKLAYTSNSMPFILSPFGNDLDMIALVMPVTIK